MLFPVDLVTLLLTGNIF